MLSIALFVTACGTRKSPASLAGSSLTFTSLDQLTVERLRARSYGSTISSVLLAAGGDSYLADYDSDGLRIVTRIDTPTERPNDAGYPVVIFLHGWVGEENAPEFDFYVDGDYWYGELIQEFVTSGYVVLTPGFRGHGGSDGIEYLHAWDNGSYLSPVFYAVDILNLIDGLGSLAPALDRYENVAVDLSRIYLASHSQGGDVALIVAAVSGEGSPLRNKVTAASIWSGTFPSRLTQLETYYAMQTTTEAFIAGDGAWNGTAIGSDGSVNPNFVFGFPPDWIVTLDESQWTWQKDVWSLGSVADAWAVKLDEMYDTANARVEDIDNAHYAITFDENGTARISHDERLANAVERVGAFHLPQYLSEPLALHFSDRDFYSLPDWNLDLCKRVNSAGGDCRTWEYPGTNHSLRVSEHEWFSPAGTTDGFHTALTRDLRLFEAAR